MKIAASSPFTATPTGAFPARLIKIIDLGTQSGSYQGQDKSAHKIMMTFELLGEERMDDGRPFAISQRFTASMHEKASLRKFIGQWRGRSLSNEEVVSGFDIDKLLGVYALINVSESERDGKTYTNIGSIMPLPKGMPKPEGVNPLQLFDLTKPDWALFETLSERLKETITASPEYQAAQGWGDSDKSKTTASDSNAFDDESIPF